MKTLLHKVALAATAVAVSAGTITLSAGSASAAEPDDLQDTAMTECALPSWDGDTFNPGTPTTLTSTAADDLTAPGGEVIGQTASYIAVISRTTVPCVVTEVEEPATIKGNSDSRASIVLQFTQPVLVVRTNPAYRTSPTAEQFSYFAGETAHTFADIPFLDHDNDSATARVARIGVLIESDELPAVRATITGSTPGATGMDQTVTVTAQRTAAEKATSLQEHRSRVKVADKAHTKAKSSIRAAKSKARARITSNDQLSAKAEKSRLNAADTKYRKKYRAASKTCATTRAASLSTYRAEVADYVTTKTVRQPGTPRPYQNTGAGTLTQND